MNSLPDKQFLSIYIPDFPTQVLACWDYDLWKQPYVVTKQSTGNDRSVIICVSELARRRGIYPGMSVQKVRTRYRDVQILKENAELQRRAREEIIAICRNYTPAIQGARMRRVLTLDLTGASLCRGDQHHSLGHCIQERIREEIGFRVICLGSAASAFISALCARSARPNQIKKCENGCESSILANINAELLPNLLKETRERLRNLNLKTIGDIQNMSKAFLMSRIGQEGEKLYAMIRGIDTSRKRRPEINRIRSEVVFTVNTNKLPKLYSAIHYGSDQFTFKLRQHKMKTDRLTMVITFSDSKITQQTHRFNHPTWKFMKIHDTAMELFAVLFNRRVAIRKIAQISGRLLPDDGQLHLFDTAQEKDHQRVGEALDKVRCIFGFDAIQNADVIGFLSN